MKKTNKNTGDDGYCFLISGKKVKKSHRLVKVYAATDDVICHLGFLKTNLPAGNKRLGAAITRIQKDLVLLNAYLSGGRKKEEINAAVGFLDKEVEKLKSETKPLKKFMIPGTNNISLSRFTC